MMVLDEGLRQSLFDLPVKDRLALADDLWDSVNAEVEPAGDPVDAEAAWGEELRNRINDLLAGRVEAIPGEELMKRLDERRAARQATPIAA